MNFLSCFDSFSMSDDECGGECEQEHEPDVLEIAVIEGNLTLISQVLSEDPNSILNWRGRWGRNLLHTAAYFGSVSVISFFVNTCGYDINSINDDGENALFYAVLGNQLEAVRALVRLRINVSQCDKWEHTPLEYVQQQDAMDVILGENPSPEAEARLQAISRFLTKAQLERSSFGGRARFQPQSEQRRSGEETDPQLERRGRFRSGSVSGGDQFQQRGRSMSTSDVPKQKGRRSKSMARVRQLLKFNKQDPPDH